MAFKPNQENVNFVIEKLSMNQIPADILQKIGPILNVEYPNEAVFKSAISSSLKNAEAIHPYMSLIVQQARKEHVLFEEGFEPNIVQGNDCDCYRDNFSRLTYGFYPFWEIEKKPKEGKSQKTDFSVLSRIGLYSFPVDKSGRVDQNFGWLKQIDEFLKTAHRYRTKVDLVLYSANWGQWDQLAKRQEFHPIDEFASNLVNAFQKGDHKVTDWFKNRIGFRKTLKFDGLTIDLSGFGKDNWPYVIRLIKEIRENLQKTGNNYHLNVIIPGQDIDDFVKALSSLREIIPDNETEIGPVDYFIVFLKNPITINKKTLRRKIEGKFKGIERRNIFRKIIPVLSASGRAKEGFDQLFDDLIYMEDNYGGVGFWPLPVVKDGSDNQFSSLLRQVFELDYTAASSLTSLSGNICKTICPNRWVVRIIWGLFVLLALVCLILYYGFCRMREVMNRYFLFIFAAVILPVVLIGFSLFMCDPLYSKITEGNAPLLSVIAGIVVYSILSYWLKRRKADIP